MATKNTGRTNTGRTRTATGYQTSTRKKRKKRTVRWDRILLLVIAIVLLTVGIGKSARALGITKAPFEERYQQVPVFLHVGETVYDIQLELVPSLSSDEYHELMHYFKKVNGVSSAGTIQPGTYIFFEPISK